ncbi:21044_t:CDS:1, partial [Gigaspora margarita]
MDDQALTDTANAINALATTMTNGGPKKNLLTVSFVTEDGTQNPLE